MQLSSTKSQDGAQTLLHFLADNMNARDNVFVERDLLHLEAASRVDIADLNKRINAMKKTIEKVNESVGRAELKS